MRPQHEALKELPGLLSANEAAEALGISASAVRFLARLDPSDPARFRSDTGPDVHRNVASPLATAAIPELERPPILAVRSFKHLREDHERDEGQHQEDDDHPQSDQRTLAPRVGRIAPTLRWSRRRSVLFHTWVYRPAGAVAGVVQLGPGASLGPLPGPSGLAPCSSDQCRSGARGEQSANRTPLWPPGPLLRAKRAARWQSANRE